MNQEKTGKFIKQIRINNNLTQKEFADKYKVTYQAVSKWERGINLPDNSLLKQISSDFNVSLDELYNGEFRKKQKNSKKNHIILISIIILIMIFTIILITKINNSFEVKTISSVCKDFEVEGTISYDRKKSIIYISNIKYCGINDDTKYKKIECNLYQNNKEKNIKLKAINYNKKTTLDEFLKDIKISNLDLKNNCKKYNNNTFYLVINAYLEENKFITYKIPLKLNNCN